jgi:hypothetical protein
MLCNKNVGMVNVLAKNNPGKFKVTDRPAKDHADELKKLGIASHGVVCKQGDKVLWQHDKHKMSQAELDAGLKTVLAAIK